MLIGEPSLFSTLILLLLREEDFCKAAFIRPT
jgi:hypothetical protein